MLLAWIVIMMIVLSIILLAVHKPLLALFGTIIAAGLTVAFKDLEKEIQKEIPKK